MNRKAKSPLENNISVPINLKFPVSSQFLFTKTPDVKKNFYISLYLEENKIFEERKKQNLKSLFGETILSTKQGIKDVQFVEELSF